MNNEDLGRVFVIGPYYVRATNEADAVDIAAEMVPERYEFAECDDDSDVVIREITEQYYGIREGRISPPPPRLLTACKIIEKAVNALELANPYFVNRMDVFNPIYDAINSANDFLRAA
jgi:hypothetical protein